MSIHDSSYRPGTFYYIIFKEKKKTYQDLFVYKKKSIFQYYMFIFLNSKLNQGTTTYYMVRKNVKITIKILLQIIRIHLNIIKSAKIIK